jgi:hypothetical protein
MANKHGTLAVRRKERVVTESHIVRTRDSFKRRRQIAEEVAVNMLRRTRTHRHHEVTTHVIRQRAGVPYEVEQRVCSECRAVLAERQLRRAAA